MSVAIYKLAVLKKSLSIYKTFSANGMEYIYIWTLFSIHF